MNSNSMNLINAGSQLANIAHNLAQRAGQPLAPADAALLDAARAKWDEARRAPPALAGLTDEQIDRIGEQWDGCIYDGPSGNIDIGAAVRAELKKLPTAPVTYSPHTGAPRDPRDIASDPQAILCVEPGKPLMAAQVAKQPAAPAHQVAVPGIVKDAMEMLDGCLDVTMVEPEDAAAWQIVRRHITTPPAPAPAVPQPIGAGQGLAGADERYAACHATIRDLDKIGMQFAADLLHLPVGEGSRKRNVDYLTRDDVLGLVANWRAAWDKNSAKRIPVDRAVLAAQPPAGGQAVPDEWISEVVGPEVDDLSYGQGFRDGFNRCRAKWLAAAKGGAA